MKWKMIMIIVCCVWMTTGCRQQETVSLQTETATEEDVTEDSSVEDGEQIYVYVCGHVNQPGVYALDDGSRCPGRCKG